MSDHRDLIVSRMDSAEHYLGSVIEMLEDAVRGAQKDQLHKSADYLSEQIRVLERVHANLHGVNKGIRGEGELGLIVKREEAQERGMTLDEYETLLAQDAAEQREAEWDREDLPEE